MKTSFLPFLDQRNYFKDFCPVIVRAEILGIITSLFERNNVFIKSFRFLLTLVPLNFRISCIRVFGINWSFDSLFDKKLKNIQPNIFPIFTLLTIYLNGKSSQQTDAWNHFLRAIYLLLTLDTLQHLQIYLNKQVDSKFCEQDRNILKETDT